MAQSLENAREAIQKWIGDYHGRTYAELKAELGVRRDVSFEARNGVEYSGVVWVEATGSLNPILRATGIVYRAFAPKRLYLLKGTVGLMSSGRFNGPIAFEGHTRKLFMGMLGEWDEILILAFFLSLPFLATLLVRLGL